MTENRRDQRIAVGLPFLLTDSDSSTQWRCKALDVSPTGLLLEVDGEQAPAAGVIVSVAVQGAAEVAWEHINTRPMRVVRVQGSQIALTYID